MGYSKKEKAKVDMPPSTLSALKMLGAIIIGFAVVKVIFVITSWMF